MCVRYTYRIMIEVLNITPSRKRVLTTTLCKLSLRKRDLVIEEVLKLRPFRNVYVHVCPEKLIQWTRLFSYSKPSS